MVGLTSVENEIGNKKPGGWWHRPGWEVASERFVSLADDQSVMASPLPTG